MRNIFTTTMLSRGVVLRVFSRPKVTKRVTKREFIPIQLLKDVKNVGVAGELLKVRPGFMRNFLHHHNKACYITPTQGPRITVVESLSKSQVLKTRNKATTVNAAASPTKETLSFNAEEEETQSKAISLEELSSIFSDMRKRPKKAGAVVGNMESAGVESTFSLVELEASLPATFTHSTKLFPVTSEALASVLYGTTGIDVPASAILLRNSSGNTLNEISEPGTYIWMFKNPRDAKGLGLKRTLRVQ